MPIDFKTYLDDLNKTASRQYSAKEILSIMPRSEFTNIPDDEEEEAQQNFVTPKSTTSQLDRFISKHSDRDPDILREGFNAIQERVKNRDGIRYGEPITAEQLEDLGRKKIETQAPPLWKEGVKSLARGFVQLPAMAGKGLQWLDPDGGVDVVERAGQSMEQFSNKYQDKFRDDIAPSKQAEISEWYSPRRMFAYGPENLVASAAPMVAGLGVGAVAGGLAGGAAGLATLGTLFYAGSAEEKYRQAKEHGLDDDEAFQLANIHGGIEAGGELIADLIHLKLFGGATKAVKNGIIKSITQGEGVKGALKVLGSSMAGETATEIAQAASQTAISNQYGVDVGSVGENVADVIAPTIFMSLVFGGAAATNNYRISRNKKAIVETLNNPNSTPEQFDSALGLVVEAAKGFDATAAKNFEKYAIKQREAGKPIVIQDDNLYKPEKEQIAEWVTTGQKHGEEFTLDHADMFLREKLQTGEFEEQDIWDIHDNVPALKDVANRIISEKIADRANEFSDLTFKMADAWKGIENRIEQEEITQFDEEWNSRANPNKKQEIDYTDQVKQTIDYKFRDANQQKINQEEQNSLTPPSETKDDWKKQQENIDAGIQSVRGSKQEQRLAQIQEEQKRLGEQFQKDHKDKIRQAEIELTTLQDKLDSGIEDEAEAVKTQKKVDRLQRFITKAQSTVETETTEEMPTIEGLRQKLVGYREREQALQNKIDNAKDDATKEHLNKRLENVQGKIAAIEPETTPTESTVRLKFKTLDDARKDFIDKKIQEIGSIEAVQAKYKDDAVVDNYARERAREIFGETTPAVSENLTNQAGIVEDSKVEGITPEDNNPNIKYANKAFENLANTPDAFYDYKNDSYKQEVVKEAKRYLDENKQAYEGYKEMLAMEEFKDDAELKEDIADYESHKKIYDDFIAKADTAPQPQAKEAWEMTREEFVSWSNKETGLNPNTESKSGMGTHLKVWGNGHKTLVENALKKSKSVPDSVLADYPDLQEKYGKPAQPQGTEKGETETVNGLLEPLPEGYSKQFFDGWDKAEGKTAPHKSFAAVERLFGDGYITKEQRDSVAHEQGRFTPEAHKKRVDAIKSWLNAGKADAAKETPKAVDRYVQSMLDFDVKQNQQAGGEEYSQEKIEQSKEFFKKSANNLIDAVEQRNFDSLSGRLRHYNKKTLRLFSDYTGIEYSKLNSDKNIEQAIRSIDPVKYDEWVESKQQKKDQKVLDEKTAKQNELKERLDKLNGHGEDLSPMQLANTEKALKKVYRFDGKVMSMQEKIDDLVLNEKVELKVFQEDKVKEWTRRQFNQATGEEQREHEQKVKEGGKVNVYYVGGYKVPKLVYDYADYIKAKSEGRVATEEDLKHLFGEDVKEDEISLNEISGFSGYDTPKADTKPKNLHDFVANHLRNGGNYNSIVEARKHASQFDGKLFNAGTEKAKQLEETIEAAAVTVAREIVQENITPQEKFDKLLDLQDRMPNLNTRTSTSIKNQAYSTPLSLAYIASELAGINQNTTVFEPTAGNGALIIGANPKNVIANEINGIRANFLKRQGHNVSTKDATQLEQKAESQDVVIANPPFGTVKDKNGETAKFKINEQYTTTQIDHAIALKALETMKPDGKAVLIVGSVSEIAKDEDKSLESYRQGDKVRFYKTLYSNYNVVDHFTVSGKLYAKQGAAWPVDVIVIHGKGKASRRLPGAELPKKIKTFDGLKDKLNEKYVGVDAEGIRQSRPSWAVSNMGQTGNSNQITGNVSGFTEQSNTNVIQSGSEGTRGVSNSGRDSQGMGKDVDRASDVGRKLSDTRQGERGTRDANVESDSNRPDGSKLDNQSGLPNKADTTEQSRGRGVSEVKGEQRTSNMGGNVRSRIEEELANTSEAELDSILDDVFGKEESKEEKNKTTEQTPEQFLKDHIHIVAPDFGQTKKKKPTTKDLTKKAGIETVKGVQDAVKGLSALFTPKNTLSSGFVFNEETYQAAKPYFQSAWQHAKEAGFTIKELVQHLANQFDASIRPYLKRFLQDQQQESITTPPKEESKKPTKRQQSPEVKETEYQTAYTPASKATSVGTLVPTNMKTAVEKALSDMQEDHGLLDDYVAEKLGYRNEDISKYFSAEQIDAIAMAIHNIDNNAGFIIGDQTGIGKGRVVAAMIRYSMKKGITPIFMTEKTGLFTDMYRDLSDIGMADIHNKILVTNNSANIPLTEDGKIAIKTTAKHNREVLGDIVTERELIGDYKVVFTTYDQMSDQKSIRRDLLRVLAPNAMIILDESHNAGGTDNKPQKGKSPRSQFLREIIPQSKAVFYSSATYAKRPDTMSLYSKTDMRFAVDEISKLGAAISQGGVPLQQAVASMLVDAKQYLRRERSFDGVEYNVAPVSVNIKHTDTAAASFREIKEFSDGIIGDIVKNLKKEAAETGDNAGGASSASDSSISTTGFASVMHNLIGQFLLAQKTQGAIQKAIESFKRGEKPVLTLSNTMGSFIADYADTYNLQPNDGVGLTFKDLIASYLEKTRYYTEGTAFGKKERHYIDDAMLGNAGLREYNRIRKMIYELPIADLPVSPIDYMRRELEKAGIRVAEITGRKDIVEYQADGSMRYKRRSDKDTSTSAKVKIISDFNNDKIDALILNRSGSTGISLHAAPKYQGHKPAQRHMIIVQAEGNIDTHMQMLGRVHRTGQVVLPKYSQLMADTPAERRPAAVLSKKMASLNANTTAGTDSAVTAKNVVNFINKYGDKVCADLMMDFPELHRKLGSPLKESAKGYEEEQAASKVTGRIAMLPTAEQERLYNMIEDEYELLISQLEAMGENDLEAKTYQTDAKTLEKISVFQGQGSSPFASSAYAERVDMKKLSKSYTQKEVMDKLRQSVYGEEAADQTLDDILKDAKEKQVAIYNDILKQYDDYVEKQLEKIDDEGRRIQKESFYQAGRDDWKSIARGMVTGAKIELMDLSEGNFFGENSFAIVLKVEQKGKPKNLLSMGTWRVTFLVPDSMRQITYNFRQLYNESKKGRGFHFNLIATQEDLAEFDDASTNARETRTILTGNLLAAFGKFIDSKNKGRIINYTDDRGNVKQGILMPAKFNLAEASKNQKVVVSNTKDVFKLLSEEITLSTKDSNFEVGFDKSTNEYFFATALSKARGGMYFLDDNLTSIVGDFIKNRNGMVASTKSKAKVEQALSYILSKGSGFRVESVFNQTRARAILGIPEPKGFDNDAPPAGVRYSKAQPVKPATPASLDELPRRQRKIADSLIKKGTLNPLTNAQALNLLQQSGEALYSTSAEVAAFRLANNLPEIKMRKDGSHPTQIATTKSTYRKIYDFIMPDFIKNGKLLDYGAGKNIGGKELGIDTYEPYPEQGFNPTFATTESIASNSYDGIINNAVLNVVPDDIRDAIVKEIGRILKPNGKAYINVRGKDVFDAKHHIIDKSKMEVIIDGNKAYQKGFTQDELVQYLSDTLGEQFTVEAATGKNNFGAVGAIITKKSRPEVLYSQDGLIQGFVLNGKAYIVPENIESGKMWGVIRHEVGTHIGQQLHNDPEFNRLKNRVKLRRDEQSPTGEAIRKAYSRAEAADTNPEFMEEEVLGYLVEDSPDVSIARKLIALIKKYLAKIGINYDLTQADMVALADIAVRREANRRDKNRQQNPAKFAKAQSVGKPLNPDIRFSIAAQAQAQPFSIPDKMKMFSADTFKYNFLSTLMPVKKAQEALEKSTGKPIPSEADLLAKETLRMAKVKQDIEDLGNRYLKPIEQRIADNSLELEQVQDYLYALHAPEANERLKYTTAKEWLLGLDEVRGNGKLERKIKEIDAYLELNPFENPKNLYFKELENELAPANLKTDEEKKYRQDWLEFIEKPSGMTTKEANEIIEKTEALPKAEVYKEISSIFDKMNAEKLLISYRAGRMTREEYVALSGAFEHYAPLHRVGYEDSRSGGHGSGLQNRGRDFMARGGSTKRAVDILAHAVNDYVQTVAKARKAESARAFKNLVESLPKDSNFIVFGKAPTRAEYDGSGNIRHVLSHSLQDNEVEFKVDGIMYLAKANKNNDYAKLIVNLIKDNPEKTGVIVKGLSIVNRGLAMVNTSMSPEFLIFNPMRDIQTAAIGLQATDAAHLTKEVVNPKNLKKAFGALRQQIRTGRAEGEWGKAADRYFKSGSAVGWLDSVGSIEGRVKKIKNEIDLLRPAKDLQGKKKAWILSKKTTLKVFDAIMDYNSILENTLRLSAFHTAMKNGFSEEKAAILARQLTVDFGQKGAYGQVANSLYLFANAGLQGSAKVISTITKSKKAQKIVLSMIGISALLTMANIGLGGDDEDGIPNYDKIDDFVKEKNIVIMMPDGKAVTIPLAWGFNVFWKAGEEIGRAFMDWDRYSTIEGATRMLKTTLNAFNPLQSATLAQTLSPTILDPIVSVGENKNWAGSPLMPEQNQFSKYPEPDSQRYFKSARALSVDIAQGLNSLTGGNDIKAGLVDISPETLDLVWDTFTGSAGRFIANVGNVAVKKINGDDVALKEIPFVRRVVNEKSEYMDSSLFRKNAEHIYQLHDQAEKYPERIREFKKDKAYYLLNNLQTIEKRLRRLYKKRKALTAQEDIDRIQETIDNTMMKFNALYNKAVR